MKQAKAHGCEVLSAMQSQAGRPLTAREEIAGRFAESDTRPIRDRIETTAAVRPETANPYADHLGRLRTSAAHTPDDVARKAKRVEMYQNLAQGVEQAREAAKIKAERQADAKVVNARQHAKYAYDAARLDRHATPAEVAERERLLALIDGDELPVAEYWQQSDKAHEAWVSRLDAMAAEKQDAANDARVEARSAREAATLARTEERPEENNE